MLDQNLNFFQFIATFTDTGQNRLQYTNDKDYYEGLVTSWGHLADLNFQNLVPTQEQRDRLEAVKEIEADKSLNVADCAFYVQHGVVTEDAPDWLQPLYNKEANLTYYRNLISAQAAAYRYDQEAVGVEYNGFLIDTSREHRKVFNDVHSDLKEGSIHKTEWKAKNGFLTITRAEASEIKTLIANHLSACFYAEEKINEEVNSSEDIVNYDIPTSFALYYEEWTNTTIVPWFITMRQAHRYLLEKELLQQVEDGINSLPSPNKEYAQVEWKTSTEVHRYRHFVTLLTTSLGWTEEQADQFFIEASKL